MDNLLTIKLDGCIIITNKYRTVLNGSSNVWDFMTETCCRLRGRMESRREVIQELLPERRFARQPAGNRYPARHWKGISGDAGKVVVMTIRVVPQSEGFVSF